VVVVVKRNEEREGRKRVLQLEVCWREEEEEEEE
jgi:hypothetical protein